MKKYLLSSVISLACFSVNAQTTLKYSGTSVFTHNSDANYKVGNVSIADITTARANNHVGSLSYGTNATGTNIGVLGSTKVNTVGFPTNYIGVFGDNVNNNINVDYVNVYGGYFAGYNLGANSSVYGIRSIATAQNNSNTSEAYGVDAEAVNFTNTVPQSVIAIKGVSKSGSSTINNFMTEASNPGGYFLSNDGQGVFATTNGGYQYINLGKISQAITGYSNQTNMYLNIGVVGTADGTGTLKYGIYGRINGTAGTNISAAIVGDDNINTTLTYAGLFNGKVKVNGNVSIDGNLSFVGNKVLTGYSASFTSNVCAANITCPSDIRFKKNIIPLENSLSNILKVNGVRYDWKQEEFPEKNFSDKNQIGFIAQEIEKIFPEMVVTDEKGFKSVDYAHITPVLVEAIKELTMRNEKLEAKNQTLDSRLDKIEAILSASNPSTGK